MAYLTPVSGYCRPHAHSLVFCICSVTYYALFAGSLVNLGPKMKLIWSTQQWNICVQFCDAENLPHRCLNTVRHGEALTLGFLGLFFAFIGGHLLMP